jgi:hypothetical protein
VHRRVSPIQDAFRGSAALIVMVISVLPVGSTVVPLPVSCILGVVPAVGSLAPVVALSLVLGGAGPVRRVGVSSVVG